ncbi:MAG: hypothetical protein U9N86_04870 [Bacteroidota bacterium]|nr:hypothetical protein [Bacteroidota bacterium]
MDYLKQVFTSREEVFSFPFEEETLLIPAPGNMADFNQLIAVNDAGFIFWKLLIEGKSADEICRYWSEKFNIDLIELQDVAMELLYILLPILKEKADEQK